jgi:hypothetical protein
MNYGDILSRAWKITWKHKILWIFGILAAMGQGGNNTSSFQADRSDYANLPSEWARSLDQAGNYLARLDWWVWVLAAVVFVVLLFVCYALSTFGLVGLTAGTRQAGMSEEKLRFGGVAQLAKPYYWRVFGFNLLAGLAIVLSILILVVPFIWLGVLTDGVAALLLIPIFCIVIIPGSIILGVVLRQAVIAMIIEDLGMRAGFSRGWQVVRHNPGPIVVMAIILAVGSGIVGFIIAIPVLLAFTPVIIPLITGAVDSLQTGVIIALALLCVYSPVMLAASGILATFTTAAWVLTYQQLTQPTPAASSPVDVLPETPPQP